MPYDEVMHKFGEGKLHSGSPSGPKVKDKKQALAIMLDEKRKAMGGDKEYQPKSQPSPSAAPQEENMGARMARMGRKKK